MSITRRGALIAGASAAVGAGLALGSDEAAAAYEATQPLPFSGSPASLVSSDPNRYSARSGRIVWSADIKAKAMALTFDDGPHPQWTPRVLAALRRADVPATFFCKGRNVAKYGYLHRDSVGKHELGNHTYDHHDLGRLDFDEVLSQMQRTTDAMKRAWGVEPTLFRPPYGHVGGSSLIAAAALGMTTIVWSAQFREVALHAHPARVVADTAAMVHPGAIVLGHDIGTRDRLIAIDRLDEFVGRFKDDGWTFHTVSDLLALESA